MDRYGIGKGLSSFMDSFNVARQNRKENAMIRRADEERERQIAAQEATNALIGAIPGGGMMTQGQAPVPGATAPVGQGLGVFPVSSVQAPQKMDIKQILSMTPEQQQKAFGRDFKGADLAQVATVMKSFAPEAKKSNKAFQEMTGEKGFGVYLVDKDTGEASWVGGAKPESPKDGGIDVDSEMKLRKEFAGKADYFNKISDSYSTIQSVAGKDSPAGDIGLVFAIMKMFDPGSVVRESEFATAQNAAGVPERIRNVYNQALEGVRLSPKQRADFVGTADRIYETQRGRFQEEADYYSWLADQSGFDPKRIVRVPKTLSKTEKKPPTMDMSLKRGDGSSTNKDPLNLGL